MELIFTIREYNGTRIARRF